MRRNKDLVICINNDGYPASLEVRKVYERIPDQAAESNDQYRVIDESGEDYLYPRKMFATAVIPMPAWRASGSHRRKAHSG